MIITSPYNFISNIRTRSVLEFGAKGDGTFEDTAAFQAAANSGEPVIYIPRTPSSYVITDEILLPSNVTFIHDFNAKLIRKSGSLQAGEAHFYRNADYVNGNSNIHIIGGYFDCNGANNTRVDQNGYGGGVGFRFKGLTNGSFRDATIKDPNCFSFQSGNTTNLLVENITFEQPYAGTNQDGIHVNGPAARTTIRNVGGKTRDDMVAILANERTQFAMGSSGGDVSNVFIDGVYGDISGATEAVRLVSGGNAMDEVHINNIGGVFPNGLVRITDESLGTPNITNLEISNISGTKHTTSMGAIHFGTSVKSASIVNVSQRISNSTTDPIVLFASGKTFDSIEISNVNISNATDLDGLVKNNGTIKKLALSNCSQTKYSGNKFGSFIHNDGGTIDSVSVNGCNAQNVVSFIKNAGGVLRRASVNGCDLEDATNFLEVTGTAATKTKLRTSSNQVTNVTNVLNLNSQPVALSGIDLLVDRTVLTPDTGDLVNDSTDLLKQWDGGAWV